MAEDLRTQILGQLSERLNYEHLYSQAISDPELKRTRLELEAALSNANEARQVVFELFQDLDRFTLNDYQPFSDTSEGMGKLVQFLRVALEDDGKQLTEAGEGLLTVNMNGNGQPEKRLTTVRDQSLTRQDVAWAWITRCSAPTWPPTATSRHKRSECGYGRAIPAPASCQSGM